MQDAIPDAMQEFVSCVIVDERCAKRTEAEELTELLICAG